MRPFVTHQVPMSSYATDVSTFFSFEHLWFGTFKVLHYHFDKIVCMNKPTVVTLELTIIVSSGNQAYEEFVVPSLHIEVGVTHSHRRCVQRCDRSQDTIK